MHNKNKSEDPLDWFNTTNVTMVMLYGSGRTSDTVGRKFTEVANKYIEKSSNNAVVGSAMIPLLTLGIPGDGVTAILLGALTMKGLTPGPTLFTAQANITYAIIIGSLVANLILLYQGYFLTQAISRIIQISYKYLCQMLMVFCFAGAFANANNKNEMIMIVPLAIFAYIIDKLGFSVVPMMLGLILGPLVESKLTRSLTLKDYAPDSLMSHFHVDCIKVSKNIGAAMLVMENELQVIEEDI